MSKIKRAYRYRFYPTDEQRSILARTFGCTRYVYNWALRLKKATYQQKGKRSVSCNSGPALLLVIRLLA